MRFYFYFFILATLIIAAKIADSHQSYWLWAGIPEKLAPKNSDFYIYQGIIWQDQKQVHYQHKGLYPYPISCKKCYLVYRLDSPLPDAKQVVAFFLDDAKKWNRHQVAIRGLQIDYDSPTAKLADYSQFLIEIRKCLPSQYELDITGLGDWIMAGSAQSLKTIASVTQDITFQLYDNRHLLPLATYYIQALKHYPYPFRLGLLNNLKVPKDVHQLQTNKQFLGIIYFIQKD